MYKIFLVEDNYGDIFLLQEVLKRVDYEIELTIARDGEEAISRLNDHGISSGIYMPDLIFLDLNLPQKTGKEVLKEIRETENLKTIPVVILTTSQNEEDIYDSYKLGANSFITKLSEFSEYVSTIKSVIMFFNRNSY